MGFAAAQPIYKLLQRSNNAEMADRAPRRDSLGGGDDGVGVDAVVAVEVLDRAGLAEMLDAERPHPPAAALHALPQVPVV